MNLDLAKGSEYDTRTMSSEEKCKWIGLHQNLKGTTKKSEKTTYKIRENSYKAYIW